jgi:hypothetical protein
MAEQAIPKDRWIAPPGVEAITTPTVDDSEAERTAEAIWRPDT